MAKPKGKNKITRIAKLELIGGQAKPGPELASVGIDMGPFTKEFNDATRDRMGDVVPVIITAFSDRSFKFELKTTPAGILIKKAAGIDKGSSKATKELVGEISLAKLEEIAKYKMEDLNTDKLESAISMLKGQARNMGINIQGEVIELKEEVLPLTEEELTPQIPENQELEKEEDDESKNKETNK